MRFFHKRSGAMDAARWSQAWNETLDATWPTLPRGPIVATGGGLSAWAARAWIDVLSAQGRAARFVPLSAFATAPSDWGHRGAARVVFSCGLSPNARIALRAPGHRGLWVATSASADALWRFAPDAHRIPLPSIPANDAWAVSAVLVAAFARLTGAGGRAPEWTSRVGAQAPDAIVHGPGLASLAHLLGWGLMEHTGRVAPHVVDAMDLAHGTLKALAGRSAHVWLLPTAGGGTVWAQVRASLATAGARTTDFGAHGVAFGTDVGALRGSWLRALATAAQLPAGQPRRAIDDGPLYGLEHPAGRSLVGPSA